MICYITHDYVILHTLCHVMLYNTRYAISQMLCYITHDYVMLYNTHDVML